MGPNGHRTRRAVLIWTGLTVAVLFPLVAAAQSPLLAWREPIYIASGFAGIVALALLLLQPLLATGSIPGLGAMRGRRLHRLMGGLLILSILAHVGGLWITSPPDVVDALLFRSPTPFSAWGVIAMWAVFATGLLALVRSRLTLPIFRAVHTALAVVIICGAIVHTLLIEGTMEPISKVILCAIVLLVGARVVIKRRSWAAFIRRKS